MCAFSATALHCAVLYLWRTVLLGKWEAVGVAAEVRFGAHSYPEERGQSFGSKASLSKMLLYQATDPVICRKSCLHHFPEQ